MTVNDLAARGFDRAGDAYERGRPSYPRAAVDLLVRELGIAAGSDVLDVGAGTGKFTRLLAPTGARLVAVEPAAGMRAVLAGVLPGLPVLEGSAEALPLGHASVDTVVVAQAFHWFDGPAALAEIARVLRPGGGLGLIWNVRDESAGWVADLTALLDEHAGEAPRYRNGHWRAAFDSTPLFAPLAEHRFASEHAGDVAAMRDRVASVSFVAALPDDARERLLRRVEAVVAPQADAAGRVVMPCRTDVYWTRARPPGASAGRRPAGPP